jgi:hypothetical protein
LHGGDYNLGVSGWAATTLLDADQEVRCSAGKSTCGLLCEYVEVREYEYVPVGMLFQIVDDKPDEDFSLADSGGCDQR